MLEARQLTKKYTDKPAVRNVSLTLEPGRILALVGESGSGKSTLLNLLAGLTDADAGTVLLNGERVVGPSETLVAGHPAIRLVHQEYQLMPNVSVQENIAYALRFFEKTYREYRVGQLLKLCRLTDVQDRLPRQVSGGEKQRTAIARAIADKPAVLLLDEPFSHLDLPNRLIVRDLLFDLMRNEQTACLFVTHDASDALALADTLGILHNGKLIQLGLPEDIYHRPLTAYAARMTGLVNIFRAKHLPILSSVPTTEPDTLYCLRPEHVELSNSDTGVLGTVQAVYFRGSHYEVSVAVSRYLTLRLLTRQPIVQPEQPVWLTVPIHALWLLTN